MFANFFWAVAMIASQEIDLDQLDPEDIMNWLELDAAFLVAMETYHGYHQPVVADYLLDTEF